MRSWTRCWHSATLLLARSSCRTLALTFSASNAVCDIRPEQTQDIVEILLGDLGYQKIGMLEKDIKISRTLKKLSFPCWCKITIQQGMTNLITSVRRCEHLREPVLGPSRLSAFKKCFKNCLMTLTTLNSEIGILNNNNYRYIICLAIGKMYIYLPCI